MEPTQLTRRQSKDMPDCWHVYYGDVRVGTVTRRSGVPADVDQWGWDCGFYPGMHPRDCRHGSAATFEAARADFEEAWRALLPTRTEADFEACRRSRDFTAWKYAMWDAGMTMPTQMTDGRSRCFCGAEITIGNVDQHVLDAHRGEG